MQLTYEGLLDEVFGLSCGQLKMEGEGAGAACLPQAPAAAGCLPRPAATPASLKLRLGPAPGPLPPIQLPGRFPPPLHLHRPVSPLYRLAVPQALRPRRCMASTLRMLCSGRRETSSMWAHASGSTRRCGGWRGRGLGEACLPACLPACTGPPPGRALVKESVHSWACSLHPGPNACLPACPA